jgi:hypothetical protein
MDGLSVLQKHRFTAPQFFFKFFLSGIGFAYRWFFNTYLILRVTIDTITQIKVTIQNLVTILLS